MTLCRSNASIDTLKTIGNNCHFCLHNSIRINARSIALSRYALTYCALVLMHSRFTTFWRITIQKGAVRSSPLSTLSTSYVPFYHSKFKLNSFYPYTTLIGNSDTSIMVSWWKTWNNISSHVYPLPHRLYILLPNSIFFKMSCIVY